MTGRRACSNRHLRAHRLSRQPITDELDLVRTFYSALLAPSQLQSAMERVCI